MDFLLLYVFKVILMQIRVRLKFSKFIRKLIFLKIRFSRLEV